ncbi:MAG: hypothetical protein FJW34_01620 [Acidobacteria bacterium]|nr:hypothetical protein [Acidobacteriota bacterium]
MPRTVLLCAILAAATLLAAAAELSQVRSVYLLPMGGGLDQHLANRLTNAAVFQVVTDPKKADAVFTEHLGPVLEGRLDEWFPEPPPPAAEASKKAEPTKEEKKKEAAQPVVEVPTAPPVVRSTAFGRGKGTLFLVDAKTRVVLWSIYEKPKDTQPATLDRTARRIVERLQRDLKPK